jgi:hypothetical protein
MFKRYWGIVIVVLLVGVIFGAKAQEGEQITQPTVDAAVATLIAQTQQPLAVTQTIQAALERALTATAQIPPPTTTPQPLDVANLSLSGTTELDLMTGPGRTAAYLAPDGLHVAHLDYDSLCIYEGEQQQRCVDISAMRSVDTESIRWSPDSRYLTLTEDFYVTFVDPDIWLIDASDGTLRDLTDDSENEGEFSDDTWLNIDLLPNWTDDGQIIYARFNRISRSEPPPEIHQIAVDGSGDAILGTIDTNDDPFAIFALNVWRDKLVYIYFAQGETPNNGVWVSDLDGANARQINQSNTRTPMSAVEMSPDGKYALYRVETTALRGEYTPETSWMRVVEIETGKEILIDPDHFVAGAGWSPQGSALIYATYDPVEQSGGVFLTDMPGKAGQPLLEGRFNIPTGRLRQFFTWGANNTILLSRSPARGIVLMQLEP